MISFKLKMLIRIMMSNEYISIIETKLLSHMP